MKFFTIVKIHYLILVRSLGELQVFLEGGMQAGKLGCGKLLVHQFHDQVFNRLGKRGIGVNLGLEARLQDGHYGPRGLASS